jgi:cobaltochelatase CobN
MNPLKIAFTSTTQVDTLPFLSALKSVNGRFGEVVDARFWFDTDFNKNNPDHAGFDEFLKFAKTAHVSIVHLMGEPPNFKELVASLKTAGVPVFVAGSFFEQNPTYRNLSTVEAEDYEKIFVYLNHGGKTNFENLLLYLANRFVGAAYDVAAPVPAKWEGIYHPDFDYVPSLEEYLEKKIDPSRPTVGVWFHHGYWQGCNTAFIDSLVREIERQGANALPVFVSGKKDPSLDIHGFDWMLEHYFTKDGKPLVDVVISTLAFSWFASAPSGMENLAALKKIGVPVIKALMTFNAFEEWRDSPQGLSVVDIPLHVALPEFDGFLISVPIAATGFGVNPETGTQVTKYKPIPERVTKLVRLSLNWGKLRRIPNSKKRVAVIFHSYPPRNDTVGKAFGLDSSASVMNILRGLKAQGYTVASLPETSQDLMETVLNGLTNDRRWLSAKDLASRALAKTPRKQYAEWFSELPKEVSAKVTKDWGVPPGKLFSYNGTLLVGGVVYGNVFVGLQPPRGFLENPTAIYHSPDLSVPHHYYAYYRWIRDVFKADVILHIGKHGTLEWLPGKSVGLSASCFPDIMISDLPHIYPYIINNPGEGTQAKRRGYCCIIDHLVPVMTNADAYEDLASIEVQLQEYYHAKTSDPKKLKVLQTLIWETVVQANLDRDLEVTKEEALSEFDNFLERLHGYLSELSDTQIRDGLHIFGEPPTDSRLDEFLVTLTRLSNGSVPSLRQSLAELKGYNYEELLANRGKLRLDGRTNGDVINELNGAALALMQRFHAAGFNDGCIEELMQTMLGTSNPNVRRCLAYVSSFLVPALQATTDELTNTFAACGGNYVSAGPSGPPTRGMADILPTGRNFYSVDPRSVPSAAAWRVGVALGDVLLERYLEQEGKYPESIGIVVWATDCMRTKGDDVAEILYLMGVRPMWEESTGRVVGVEAIPLDELKHPRIDVTLRISGLFRDTFPNLVHLIDDAVALVAALKERPQDNYLAAHVEAEVAKRVATGEDAQSAREEACYRVFGDQPGTYGAGVSQAIDSKNWKDQSDLGALYVTWGGYAYSRRAYGRAVPEQFKQRLSQINLTVKNDDSRECDILCCDDWYDFHGGMIVAVKTLSGKAPASFCGDSSDPDRVKVRSTKEETCHVFRSRLLNPKYIQGLQRHGYHGAAELSRAIDYIFGWDATVEAVEDWMYEDLAEKYVLDPKMQQWLKDVNPHALQNMTERLLEAIERGLWQATDEMKKTLQKLYLTVEGILEGAEKTST